MNAKQLLDEILGTLQTIKEDKSKLEKLHAFMAEEFFEEPEQEQIPDKYKKMIHSIADGLTAGLVSFVNTDTLEVEEIFKELIVYPEDMDEDFEEGESDDEFNEWETKDFKFHKWENYIEIYPLESFESFKIMEGFVYKLPGSHLKNQLDNGLNRKKPFANFNHIIHNCELKQDWFDYQLTRLERHVYDLLRDNLPD